jgi:hypothetical protein
MLVFGVSGWPSHLELAGRVATMASTKFFEVDTYAIQRSAPSAPWQGT